MGSSPSLTSWMILPLGMMGSCPLTNVIDDDSIQNYGIKSTTHIQDDPSF